MMADTIQDTIDALDELLDKERAAVLEGDLEGVGRSLALKESLIDQLNTQDWADRAALEALNEKVTRNQDLLNSALDGVRSVARRLASMRRVRNSIDTYDADGRKSKIDLSPNPSFEKRA